LVVVVFFVTWGIDALKNGVLREPWQMLAMLGAKVGLFVFVPFVLFYASGKYKIRELMPASSKPKHLLVALWMSLVLILFQTVFGRGVSEIRHSGLPLWAVAVGLPLAYVWLLVEVGLVEEFFFRVLLQSRLSALLRSEVAGIVLMALLFGLAHAPGLHFRSAVTLEGLGPHPSWLVAIGYSIAVTSVAGIFLGILWARTRNILVLMLVHAAGDLLPNLVQFVKAW
jgi:membrane protease YdiL (CAAX protease family)